ncbi:MAG: hypothetical protein M1832_003041 [Thelocarpon impressellum]|nr:MAG: hypothetical protein M1832_003041 [Thelocarpon impressellum]
MSSTAGPAPPPPSSSSINNNRGGSTAPKRGASTTPEGGRVRGAPRRRREHQAASSPQATPSVAAAADAAATTTTSGWATVPAHSDAQDATASWVYHQLFLADPLGECWWEEDAPAAVTGAVRRNLESSVEALDEALGAAVAKAAEASEDAARYLGEEGAVLLERIESLWGLGRERADVSDMAVKHLTALDEQVVGTFPPTMEANAGLVALHSMIDEFLLRVVVWRRTVEGRNWDFQPLLRDLQWNEGEWDEERGWFLPCMEKTLGVMKGWVAEDDEAEDDWAVQEREESEESEQE